MANSRAALGVGIIAVGVLLLLGKLGVFGNIGGVLWPFFLLVPGIALHVLYFARILPVGVLVPGGILTVYALLFFYCGIFGWDSLSYLWPVFPLGVAVGLYELYVFGHERGVLIAALILTSISVIFLAINLIFTIGIYLVAAALIVGGIYLLKSRSSSRMW
ncbi:hypothetical protein ACFQWB_01600 [Paenibacillus thermoaerophilus]|jgi:hypothetical protein|uniref:DUF5668 domain-containing protein n=1 Tax=Paenibacillus thermoaerophilus TaxID=1215385 RepID=A0ABW2V1I0_9BACL|nr:hypothetical protein [Paenibacillus thermoaerophilus]TMV19050.1 hypothetical protein FE781_00625 [Paenibacillus thermoaerophilus]